MKTMSLTVDALLALVLSVNITMLRGFYPLFIHYILHTIMQSTNEKRPRIKNGTCYGTGDGMRSNLKDGSKLPKNSPRCKVYGSIESIKNHLSFYLASYRLKSDYDEYVFKWLITNLHSLGSYVFVNGKTTDHAFPDNLLSSLETRIAQIQELTDDCMDFLILENPQLLLLDRIRIEIRELEVNYASWYFETFPESDTTLHTLYTASVLNRLSAYLFNVIRFEHIGTPERHWQGKVTEFNPPV